jgi:anti-anti-sigma factor
MLPKGSIKIAAVTIDGKDYSDYDADGLTVKIPAKYDGGKIKVTIVPTGGLEHFTARVSTAKGVSTVHLAGDLDRVAVPTLRAKLDEVVQANPDRVVLNMKELKTIDSSAVRALIFAKQKMRTDEDVEIVGASAAVKDILNKSEFAESVRFTN